MIHNQNYDTSLTALDQYIREVNRIPRLTDGEEEQLLQRVLSDKCDRRARDRLVEGYQSMIIGLAHRFARHCQHLELLDLVQEGNEGLLRAIEKYDEKRQGASFKTFAFSWVRGSMLTAIWQYEDAIRLPLNKVKAIRYMAAVTTRLLSLLGREPTIAEIAKEMEMKERNVWELVALQGQEVVSLHSLPGDGDGLALGEMIPDTSVSTSVYSQFSSLDDALEALPERERLVVQLRYGFHDGQPYTQKEVASLLGVALSTVAMVDRRAHVRLRSALSG